MDYIARDARDGKKALLSFPVTHLYLDHDLGEELCQGCDGTGGSCAGCKGTGHVSVSTGYDVLVWAIERDCVPSNVFLVTSNPVGRDRMGLALENVGYIRKNNWFIKEL